MQGLAWADGVWYGSQTRLHLKTSGVYLGGKAEVRGGVLNQIRWIRIRIISANR